MDVYVSFILREWKTAQNNIIMYFASYSWIFEGTQTIRGQVSPLLRQTLISPMM